MVMVVATVLVAPRTAAAAEATDRAWTNYARFFFRRFANDETVMVPLTPAAARS